MSGFPDLSDHKTYRWAPILFRPIHHSPEQLIVGIAVVDGEKAHVLYSNQFQKFECLFGARAQDANFAATVALNAVEKFFQDRGASGLESFSPPVSGVELGSFRIAQGDSWLSVAERWYSASSAMFIKPRHLTAVYEAPPVAAFLNAGERISHVADKLPKLVLDYVIEKRPNLDRYFNPRISRDQKSIRRKSYEAAVDYSGSRLVASFGTLFASKSAPVNIIKRRMWDLNVDKRRDAESAFMRNYEMIVQHPAKNDPQVSDKQYENILKAIDVLEREADISEIRLRPMNSVEDIGKHVLAYEDAA